MIDFFVYNNDSYNFVLCYNCNDSYMIRKYYNLFLLTNNDGLWLQVIDSNDA